MNLNEPRIRAKEQARGNVRAERCNQVKSVHTRVAHVDIAIFHDPNSN